MPQYHVEVHVHSPSRNLCCLLAIPSYLETVRVDLAWHNTRNTNACSHQKAIRHGCTEEPKCHLHPGGNKQESFLSLMLCTPPLTLFTYSLWGTILHASYNFVGKMLLTTAFMLTEYTEIQLSYGDINKPMAATDTHSKTRLTFSALSSSRSRSNAVWVLFN